MSNEQPPVGTFRAVEPDGSTGWNPPAGDVSLDDLFPNPELAPQLLTPVPQPTPQAAPEYFLKAATGTVYRTAEDAVRGTEEKDRSIERFKQELAQARQQLQQFQPQPQPTKVDFAENAFDKLAEAAQKGDKRGYISMLGEVQRAFLAPLAPLMEEVAQERAIRNLGTRADSFRTFVSSDEFGKTLERLPLLKNAIESAKVQPEQYGQLPELYELVYNSYLANRTNEITKDAVRSQVPAPIQTRPTLTPGTPTPVPTTSPSRISYTRDQLLANRDARKEFLTKYREERAASLDVPFSEIGL